MLRKKKFNHNMRAFIALESLVSSFLVTLCLMQIFFLFTQTKKSLEECDVKLSFYQRSKEIRKEVIHNHLTQKEEKDVLVELKYDDSKNLREIHQKGKKEMLSTTLIHWEEK